MIYESRFSKKVPSCRDSEARSAWVFREFRVCQYHFGGILAEIVAVIVVTQPHPSDIDRRQDTSEHVEAYFGVGVEVGSSLGHFFIHPPAIGEAVTEKFEAGKHLMQRPGECWFQLLKILGVVVDLRFDVVPKSHSPHTSRRTFQNLMVVEGLAAGRNCSESSVYR